jgi:hypothetical protein
MRIKVNDWFGHPKSRELFVHGIYSSIRQRETFWIDSKSIRTSWMVKNEITSILHILLERYLAILMKWRQISEAIRSKASFYHWIRRSTLPNTVHSSKPLRKFRRFAEINRPSQFLTKTDQIHSVINFIVIPLIHSVSLAVIGGTIPGIVSPPCRRFHIFCPRLSSLNLPFTDSRLFTCLLSVCYWDIHECTPCLTLKNPYRQNRLSFNHLCSISIWGGLSTFHYQIFKNSRIQKLENFWINSNR